MKEGFEFVQFDFDAVWAALSKSTVMRNYMEKLATDVNNQATALARSEAYDEGYYSDLFVSTVGSASQVRRDFQETQNKRRSRSRQGNKNRIIDRQYIKGEDGKPIAVKGEPDGYEYKGSVGVVSNLDFKAVWVEYGSIAKGPRNIMSRATESVANASGNEWEPLYDKSYQQNTTELGSKISAGKTGRTRKSGK
jgi:hypothetical protein